MRYVVACYGRAANGNYHLAAVIERERAEVGGAWHSDRSRRAVARGERERFQRLKPFIDGREVPYAALAAECGVAAGTLRKQVHDMKECYAALVRADFKRRGVKPADIDSEIRNLLAE